MTSRGGSFKGGEEIERLREELAELRAEVEQLKADDNQQKREPKPKQKKGKPRLRVIKGGLIAGLAAWINEHWRSAIVSVAASTIATGLLVWDYEPSPGQIRIPPAQAAPTPTIATRTTAPRPSTIGTRPPHATPTPPRTSARAGTVPPRTTSNRPSPTKTATERPALTVVPRLPQPPSVLTVVPTLPHLTSPTTIPSLPTNGRCEQTTIGVTVPVCVPIGSSRK